MASTPTFIEGVWSDLLEFYVPPGLSFLEIWVGWGLQYHFVSRVVHALMDLKRTLMQFAFYWALAFLITLPFVWELGYFEKSCSVSACPARPCWFHVSLWAWRLFYAQLLWRSGNDYVRDLRGKRTYRAKREMIMASVETTLQVVMAVVICPRLLAWLLI